MSAKPGRTEIGFLALLRGARVVIRAQRTIRNAKRLARARDYLRAFQAALPALGDMAELTAAEHPLASAVLATDAAFLDDLARKVGQPGAAREEVRLALQVCEELAEASPGLAQRLQQYIKWYRYRLETEPEVRAN